jgi:hypothetical protein
MSGLISLASSKKSKRPKPTLTPASCTHLMLLTMNTRSASLYLPREQSNRSPKLLEDSVDSKSAPCETNAHCGVLLEVANVGIGADAYEEVAVLCGLAEELHMARVQEVKAARHQHLLASVAIGGDAHAENRIRELCVRTVAENHERDFFGRFFLVSCRADGSREAILQYLSRE